MELWCCGASLLTCDGAGVLGEGQTIISLNFDRLFSEKLGRNVFKYGIPDSNLGIAELLAWS